MSTWLLLAQPNPGFRMDNKLVIEIDPLSAVYCILERVRDGDIILDELQIAS